MSYFSSYYDAVRYPYETDEKKGLRESQLGAIHAIASHFTNSNYPAIITMPTGAGVIIVTGCINALVSRISGTLIKYNSCIA